MKKIILSLAVVGLVGGLAGGATWAYLSDTVTVEGNTLSTGSVTLGATHELPFEIENLVPGGEFSTDLAIQYDGSTPADLYIGGKEEGGMDLGPVLQYKLERMKSGWEHDGWIVGGANNWKDIDGNMNLLADYIKTHEDLEDGDRARVRLHIRMKKGAEVDFDDIPGVHNWNDYQNMEESITLIMHAVQAGGGVQLDDDPRDYDPQITIVDENKTYSTIAAAIDDANEDDTILVPQGVYEEDVELDKDGLTLKFDSKYGGEAVIKSEFIAFTADNVTLDGFTIEDQSGERAIQPRNSDGATIKNNTIKGNYRGIQGDVHGRPTNLSVISNTFETTYGLAGTEEMTGLYVAGNTFDTSNEAIGLGVGVEVIDHNGNTLDEGPDETWLENNNDFIGTGEFVEDYR